MAPSTTKNANSDIQKEVKDILDLYIAEHHMRRTPERYAILRAIYNFKGVFTADELFEVMNKDFPVSIATIYNTLEILEKIDLVQRITYSQQLYFQKCYGLRNRFYTICTNCGAVESVENIHMSNLLAAANFRRFNSKYLTVCVYGVCSKCRGISKRADKQRQKEYQAKLQAKDKAKQQAAEEAVKKAEEELKNAEKPKKKKQTKRTK